MAKKSSSRPERNLGLQPAIRLIGYRLSTATVLFHSAVAERLGVSATDMKCFGILRETGPITAGDLADRTGLTTGAITGVIDRLEKARLARRVPHPDDRRRVVVELLTGPDREREIGALYEPMGQAMVELAATYSDSEMATVIDFLTKATSVLEAETKKMRKKAQTKPEG